MLSSTRSDAIRKRLHARRRELLAHYQNMLALADEEQGPETELVDTANEQWDLQVLSRMSDADTRALSSVIEALHRLQAGRYGLCVDCEARIEPERLAILPEAARCLSCAEESEIPGRRAS
jgi:RNA polymerase-binding transcription factor DksA